MKAAGIVASWMQQQAQQAGVPGLLATLGSWIGGGLAAELVSLWSATGAAGVIYFFGSYGWVMEVLMGPIGGIALWLGMIL